MGGASTWAPWQIILVSIAAAIVLGAIIGFVVGKHRVKRASKDYKPLLNLKERIIYIGMFVAGAALILSAVFIRFPQEDRYSAEAAWDSRFTEEGLSPRDRDATGSDPAVITFGTEYHDGNMDGAELANGTEYHDGNMDGAELTNDTEYHDGNMDGAELANNTEYHDGNMDGTELAQDTEFHDGLVVDGNGEVIIRG